MKSVLFGEIKIKNFLSIGDEFLNISFKEGINLITGENNDTGSKNGVGKSTISDALFWCLFGNTLRDLKKDKIINNKTKIGSEVYLKFKVTTEEGEKQYELTRTLEPSKIILLCDGVDITPSTIILTDELIKKIIGGNEEVFHNSVIMSSNNTVPFMAQKKIEKRKFVEGILQLNIFSEMLSKIRSEYNDYKKNNDILSNDFTNQQKNLEIFEKQKQNGEETKKLKIKTIFSKIEANIKEADSIKSQLINKNVDFDSEISILNDKNAVLQQGLDKNQIEISELTTQRTHFIFETQQLKKEKQKFLEKGDVCPVCNREYCKDDIENIKNQILSYDETIISKETEINNLNLKIDQINFNINKIKNGIEKIKDKIKEYSKNIQANLLLNQKIQHLEEKNKEYKEEILEIKDKKEDYDSHIDECNKKIENLNKSLLNIKKHLQILDSCKFIVSEDGVKTFIIKKILNILNERLNFYLKVFDAPCICEFNELFEETIYNDQGKECSYFNFSGGERKRIDVAILFMFQDILRLHSGVSYSLNIYDELFDSALDDIGIEKILNVLRDKSQKYNESIYIISHKNNTKLNVDNILWLEKTNGFTTLKA